MSPSLLDHSALPQPQPTVTAKSVVWRLKWSTHADAQVVGSDLLRDFFISKPLPLASSTFTFEILDCVPVHLEVVSVFPAPTFDVPVEGTEDTETFILPPLRPSLQQHNLLPIPPEAFVSGSQLLGLLGISLQSNSAFDISRLPIPSTFLVHGSYGTGKTSAVAHASHSAGANLIHLTAARLNSHVISPSALRDTLLYYAKAAIASAPAVVLIDDAHFIFSPDETHSTAALINMLDFVNDIATSIAIVLVVAPSADAIHPTVHSAVDVSVPLSLFVDASFGMSLATRHTALPSADIAKQLPFARVQTIADLVEWAKTLSLTQTIASPLTVSPPPVPTWQKLSTSLGGLHGPQRELRRTLLWPVTRARTLERLGLARPSATLLFGPPGTGKTALVRAAAAATARHMHPVDAAGLARGQVGASERLLTEAFASAARAAPAILFFDEIDALFAAGAAPHRTRLAEAMTALLDNVPDGVAVVAATNRPWAVAGSLLCAGRFETRIHVSLPHAEEREEIAEVLLDSTWGRDARNKLFELAGSDATNGFSGADLAGISRRAGLAAAARNEDVAVQDIEEVMKEVKPSVSQDQSEKIAAWR